MKHPGIPAFDVAGKLDDENARLLELVSPKVGIIRSLSRIVRGAEEPVPPFIYQATLSHFDYRNAKPSERVQAGKGLTERDAILGAIGEAVERYCAAHFDPSKATVGKMADLRGETVGPPEFVLYSEKQYARGNLPYHRWRPDEQLTWTSVRELPGGRDVMVPASLVYLSLPSGKPEDYLCPPTSNGLAAGPSVEFATLNALYELVERDSFLITWLCRIPPARLDLSDANHAARRILNHYARFGSEIQVFNISLDLPIYAMMAVALDRTGSGPAAVVSLGCHLDPRRALIRALLEMCQIHPGEVKRYHTEPPAGRLKSYEDVHTMEDHSAFTSIPERITEFSFMLETERRQSMGELADHSSADLRTDLDQSARALSESGCRMFYADLTTPDVTGYGLRVVRALATQLQPMHFGCGEERLGGRRIFELARARGLASFAEDDINPCPHPLA